MSLKAKIEAVIYASEEPVTLAQLASLLGQQAQIELDQRDGAQQSLTLDPETLTDEHASDREAEPEENDQRQLAREEREQARRLREYFRSLIDQLIADYAQADRGLEIREVASGFRLATKPEYHDAVRGFVKLLKPPLKLSLQALETLAVVAYKQPVTAPEISEIRGVDSGGVLGSLMARKLITTAGRKQVIGRPILYKTTRDFLLRFGLKDVTELPSIEEFERMATEFAEADSLQEEISMPQPTPESELIAALEPERGVTAPQSDGDATALDATPDGGPNDPPATRLTGVPPASTVPGTDDDPTEATDLARQIDRDRNERAFPDDDGSKPTLQPK